jgi:ferredoxin-type protein NapG
VSAFSRRDLFRTLLGRGRPTAPPPKPAPVVAYVGSSAVTEPCAPAPPVRFGRGRALPVLRPPGAIEEAAFLTGCTRCNACAEACPHQAITPAPVRLRAVAGTPVLNPAQSPCRMCEGLPCVAACAQGVLRVDVVIRMGTAVISLLDCLTGQNTTCSVCAEQCPVEGALARENGRPVVNPAACTGCGVCQFVCPAPRNAVMVLPTLNRPSAPTTPERKHEPER